MGKCPKRFGESNQSLLARLPRAATPLAVDTGKPSKKRKPLTDAGAELDRTEQDWIELRSQKDPSSRPGGQEGLLPSKTYSGLDANNLAKHGARTKCVVADSGVRMCTTLITASV